MPSNLTSTQNNTSTTTDIDPWIISLFELKEGEIDKALNKKILEIVLVTSALVVYLADDNSIQWRTMDGYIEPLHMNDVLSIVSLLEARSRFIEDKTILVSVRREVASALARCFDGGSLENSLKLLREIDIEISLRNKETSWKWYFGTTAVLVSMCGLAIAIFWLDRINIRSYLGNTGFDISIGTLCGSIGALLSVATRGDRLHLDANAGQWIHKMEAISRIGAGLAGAAFVAVAIKSGILLGGIHFQGNNLALLLAFCMTAGMSERLVPNLVQKIDKSIDEYKNITSSKIINTEINTSSTHLIKLKT